MISDHGAFRKGGIEKLGTLRITGKVASPFNFFSKGHLHNMMSSGLFTYKKFLPLYSV